MFRKVKIEAAVAVMKYVEQLDQSARDIHAVNTVVFGGQKIGHNTDGVGFSKSLEEELVNPAGRNALVIGAGGASRAILVSLMGYNANVTLTNRTKGKAEALVKALNAQDKIRVIDYNPESLKAALQDTYLIVNTTSVGMTPNVGYSPIPKGTLKNGQVVFDAVYNPLKTQLIKDAEEKGCKTISGVNMLVHQGAQSLRIWLDIEPPIQVMKDEVLKNLTN